MSQDKVIIADLLNRLNQINNILGCALKIVNVYHRSIESDAGSFETTITHTNYVQTISFFSESKLNYLQALLLIRDNEDFSSLKQMISHAGYRFFGG